MNAGTSWEALLGFLRRSAKVPHLSFLSLGWSPELLLRRLGESVEITKRDALWVYGTRSTENFDSPWTTVKLRRDSAMHDAILREENFSVVIFAARRRIPGTPEILANRSDVVAFDGIASESPQAIRELWGRLRNRKLNEQTPNFLTHRHSSALLPLFGLPIDSTSVAQCIQRAATEKKTLGIFLQSLVAGHLATDELLADLEGMKLFAIRKSLQLLRSEAPHFEAKQT